LESDSEVRDYEYINFAEDFRSYFSKEVAPYRPDSWVNLSVTDSSDKKVGLVGVEINFNKEFFVYEPPRPLESIKQEIETMEKEFMSLLKGLVK
jgi:type I restriction enzyme M protein